MSERKPEPRLRSRLVWFVLLWLAGVTCVSAIAYAIKLLIGT